MVLIDAKEPQSIGRLERHDGKGHAMKQAKLSNKNALRSARMKQRVLEEALECIFALGYQNASTVEIARRAGVSRGAMLHHYPSKEELVCAAYESLLKQESEGLRAIAGSYAEGEVSLDDFVDYPWSRFSGRSFMINIDFIAAARTTPNLKDRVERVREEYHESLDSIWRQFFADKDLPEHEAQVILNLTLCFLRGMGVQCAVQDDRANLDALASHWKAHLKGLISIKTNTPG